MGQKPFQKGKSTIITYGSCVWIVFLIYIIDIIASLVLTCIINLSNVSQNKNNYTIDSITCATLPYKKYIFCLISSTFIKSQVSSREWPFTFLNLKKNLLFYYIESTMLQGFINFIYM